MPFKSLVFIAPCAVFKTPCPSCSKAAQPKQPSNWASHTVHFPKYAGCIVGDWKQLWAMRRAQTQMTRHHSAAYWIGAGQTTLTAAMQVNLFIIASNNSSTLMWQPVHSHDSWCGFSWEDICTSNMDWSDFGQPGSIGSIGKLVLNAISRGIWKPCSYCRSWY